MKQAGGKEGGHVVRQQGVHMALQRIGIQGWVGAGVGAYCARSRRDAAGIPHHTRSAHLHPTTNLYIRPAQLLPTTNHLADTPIYTPGLLTSTIPCLALCKGGARYCMAMTDMVAS